MKNFLFHQLGIGLDAVKNPDTVYDEHTTDCIYIACSELLKKSYKKVAIDLAKIGAKQGFSPISERVGWKYLNSNGYKGFTHGVYGEDCDTPLGEFLYSIKSIDYFKNIKCLIMVHGETTAHAFVFKNGVWFDSACNILHGRLSAYLASCDYSIYIPAKPKNETLKHWQSQMTEVIME